MTNRLFAALVLAGTALLAQARPEITGVTAVVAARASGGSSSRVGPADGLARLMDELNAEQGRTWRSWRGKPGPCAVRLTLYAGEERVARFQFEDDTLIAFEASGGMSAREVGRHAMPAVRRLAGRVQDSKTCRR